MKRTKRIPIAARTEVAWLVTDPELKVEITGAVGESGVAVARMVEAGTMVAEIVVPSTVMAATVEPTTVVTPGIVVPTTVLAGIIDAGMVVPSIVLAGMVEAATVEKVTGTVVAGMTVEETPVSVGTVPLDDVDDVSNAELVRFERVTGVCEVSVTRLVAEVLELKIGAGVVAEAGVEVDVLPFWSGLAVLYKAKMLASAAAGKVKLPLALPVYP